MPFERAKTLFLEGLAHHERHRFDAAESCYRQALALMPTRVSVLTNLGAVLIAQSRFEDAQPLCERALALEPGNPKCLAQLEACRQAAASPALRLEMQERAVRTNPGDAGAHEALGATLFGQGDTERALDCFGRALRLDPESPSATIQYVRACEQLGRHEAALEACLDLLERTPSATLVAQVAVGMLLAHGMPMREGDPRLQRLLIEGLKLPLADPQVLAPLVFAALGDSLPGPATPDAALVASLARLPVLDLLLSRARATDADLEALLVRARRHLLLAAAHAHGAMPGAEIVDFCCALSRQCWLNEYCWPADDDELALVASLRTRLGSADGVAREPMALLAVAAYAPVDPLLGADWARRLAVLPEVVAAAIGQQCAIAAESRAGAASVRVATTIDDPASLQVRAQYEAHPSPRWSSLPMHVLRTGLAAFAQRRIAGAPEIVLDIPADGLRALNAGCGTGQHAIEMALRIDGLRLLAIDLSRNSLGYAMAMATRHGVGTIDFAQADMLRLPELGERFDVIDAAGALRHIADPRAGLAVLVSCLRPGGLLRIALCSRARSADRTGAPCDRRLHVHGPRYDPVGVAGLVQEQGLRLLGFEVPPSVVQRFVAEAPAARFDDPLAWDAFGRRHPDAFERMIVLWAQAPG